MSLRRCEICGGSGRIPCPACTDKASSPPREVQGDTLCSECQGKKEIRCPGCLGTGWVDMPTFA